MIRYRCPSCNCEQESADALAGRASYTDGLRIIASQRSACGLPDKDADLAGIYAIDIQRDGLDQRFEFKRSKNPAWTWQQELASYEAFARDHGEKHCRSLLARFRGDAFAGV